MDGGRATLRKGVFLVSIDLEMAWGTIHKGSAASYPWENERQCLRDLLDLMDRYEIAATWAVVGHLFLDRCEAEAGVKHPGLVRPDYPWFDGDWFTADPCQDVVQAPTWYGSDVVKLIRDRPTEHEVGSHSFSHIIAGDPGCSRDAFVSDLVECVRLARHEGLELRSFVFPRNSIGHVEALRPQGFVAYRGARAPLFSRYPARLRSLRRAAEALVPTAASVVRPSHEHGLWNLPATCMFDVASRRRSTGPWVQQVRRRMHQAARHKGLFHLWFHPHNVTVAPELALRRLAQVFAEAASLRAAGELDVMTMGGLAGSLDAGPLRDRV